MLLNSRARLGALLLCLLPLAIGCGRADDLPELGQVSGVVTMDGKPVAEASVVFIPENGRPSNGMTDNDGRYTVYLKPGTAGAIIGTHRVRISQFGEDGDTTERIPAAYNEQTTLTADVKPGENTFDFALKSKP